MYETWLCSYYGRSEVTSSAVHACSVVHGDLSGVCGFTHDHVTLLTCSFIQSNVLILENGCASIADFGLSTLLTELGGSTFAASFHERGTIRWMAPELLDLRVPENQLEEDASHVLPTTHSDVYSFGGVMLQVRGASESYNLRCMTRQIDTDSEWQSTLPLLRARNAGRACSLERDHADAAE